MPTRAVVLAALGAVGAAFAMVAVTAALSVLQVMPKDRSTGALLAALTDGAARITANQIAPPCADVMAARMQRLAHAPPPTATVEPSHDALMADYATRVALRRASRGMIDASADEISRAAVELTCSRFTVLSGTPRVLLSRPWPPGDLDTPEVVCPHDGEDGPPAWLVIVHGDLDIRSGMITPPLGGRPMLARYIAYVYNLRARAPSRITTSLDVDRFQRTLSRPTAPDAVTPIPTATMGPAFATGPHGEPTGDIPYGCGTRAAERAYMDHRWGPAPPMFTAVPTR